MDFSIDVASIIVLVGILVAAWYQRKTVEQMQRQSDATVESLKLIDSQTRQMQEQTAEIRESMANESRPVLFALITTTSPRTLLIGNHGRNPASNLRIQLADRLTLRDDQQVGRLSSPILPGGYRLVIELGETAVDLLISKIEKPRDDGSVEQPLDFVLGLTVQYRDALTEQAYVQNLQVEVLGGSDPIQLEEMSP